MNKKQLIEEVTRLVREEIEGLALNESARREDLERQLQMLRFLPTRDYERGEPIIPTSLVRARTGSIESLYFIVPSGGGWVTRVEGMPVQIVTPQSPLGEALVGRKEGETVRIPLKQGHREIEILSAQ